MADTAFDLKQSFREARDLTVAAGSGLNRGIAEFVGAIPDAVLWAGGKAAKALGADVDTKNGIMSGHYFQKALGDFAEKQPVRLPIPGFNMIPLGTHNKDKETPGQKSAREGGQVVGEVAAIGASFLVPPLAAASLPAKIAIPAVTVAAPVAQGFVEGFTEEPHKVASAPAPAPGVR